MHNENSGAIAVRTSQETILANMIQTFDTVCEMLRVDADISERIRGNAVARRIAALPYLAGCQDADQCAAANLSMYLLASMPGPGRQLFDHRPGNDGNILDRLRPIMYFRGGDQAIIDQVMSEIATVLVQGYHRDIEKDKGTGEYNPLHGSWDIHETLDSLAETPRVVETDYLGAVAMGTWWN